MALGLSGFRVDAVPVPDRDRRDHGGADGAARPARVPPRPARVPRPPPRRRHPARRGEPAAPTRARSSATRTATSSHAVRLHRRCRPPTSPWRARTPAPLVRRAAAAGRRPPHDWQWASFAAQPRRADAGQADDRRAGGGVRRVRARAGHAALRPGPPPAAAADARTATCTASAHGLQPDVLPARHTDALLRRGDRDGREPRRSRAGWRCARRCSGPPGPTAGFTTAAPDGGADPPFPTAASARTPSTCPTSGTTRTRC